MRYFNFTVRGQSTIGDGTLTTDAISKSIGDGLPPHLNQDGYTHVITLHQK